MNRIRLLLCLPALVAVALTVTPVRADPELDKTDAKEILKVLRQMQDANALLQQDVARLRQESAKLQQDNETQRRLYDLRDTILQEKLASLESRLAEAERTAKGRVSNYPSEAPTTAAELRVLKERLDRMERERSSSYFIPNEAVGPVPALGTIRVVNTSPFACTVTVNGSAYKVLAGQGMTIPNVPAGVFTYEVVSDGVGFLKRNTVPLIANSEKTLTIY